MFSNRKLQKQKKLNTETERDTETDNTLKQQIKGSQEFEIIELSAIEKNNYFKSLNV